MKNLLRRCRGVPVFAEAPFTWTALYLIEKLVLSEYKNCTPIEKPSQGLVIQNRYVAKQERLADFWGSNSPVIQNMFCQRVLQ